MGNSNRLVKFNAMILAIAECHSIDEIAQIRDEAEAFKYCLIKAKASYEAIREACKVKLWAERKAGQMLKERPKAKGNQHSAKSRGVTLQNIGITKNHSAIWQKIADVPEGGFKEYLEVEKDITSSGAIKIAQRLDRQQKSDQTISTLNARNQQFPTDKKYSVIYADPPWKYDHSKAANRNIENHYPTMELVELCALPVAELCNHPCILFMWATAPKLEQALEVLNAWGFTYTTCGVWDKQHIGMGYYFRQQTELLLIGKKGDMPSPPVESRSPSLYSEKRGKHSQKPGYYYKLVESMYPDYPKIELFSRNKRDKGWDSWGNESNNRA